VGRIALRAPTSIDSPRIRYNDHSSIFSDYRLCPMVFLDIPSTENRGRCGSKALPC